MARGVRPSTNARARAQAYRQSDAGRYARKMYYQMNPEAKLRRKMYQEAHRKAKGQI